MYSLNSIILTFNWCDTTQQFLNYLLKTCHSIWIISRSRSIKLTFKTYLCDKQSRNVVNKEKNHIFVGYGTETMYLSHFKVKVKFGDLEIKTIGFLIQHL